MKTNFFGQAYASRSTVLASQTAINIYPEIENPSLDPTAPTVISGFHGTPGLEQVFQGTGEVRGIYPAGDLLYAVIGSSVYRINAQYVAVLLGQLPNDLGPVSIIDNGSQIAFAHADGWHYAPLGGTGIAPVANSPGGSILAAQDHYVMFTQNNNGLWGITALGDLSSIDPLDTADAEGAPDKLVSILSSHREAWLFGANSTEPWQDTGAANFPFERSPGGFIEQGCAAARSVASIDNSPFWLGRDKAGQGVVYRANTYTPVRISTHALEHAINQMGDISDAIGFCYQQEGHSFYWLTFPRANQTWVYDVAAAGWHRRGYRASTGLLQRHRANCYAFFNTDHLVGDFENGRIYRLSLDVFTDNGEDIYRERAFDLPDNENKKTRLDYFELVALTGESPGNMTLEVSKDGGRVWGYERIVPMGATGKRYTRLRWRRLGKGRNLVARVSTTMHGRIEWSAAFARGGNCSQ